MHRPSALLQLSNTWTSWTYLFCAAHIYECINENASWSVHWSQAATTVEISGRCWKKPPLLSAAVYLLKGWEIPPGSRNRWRPGKAQGYVVITVTELPKWSCDLWYMPKNDKNPVKSKPGLKQGLESLQETGNFNIQNWKPIAYSPDLQVTRLWQGLLLDTLRSQAWFCCTASAAGSSLGLRKLIVLLHLKRSDFPVWATNWNTAPGSCF